MSSQVEPVVDTGIVDDALEAYVSWREECADAREAYRGWSGAGRADRVLAYCAYAAALDREEAAAHVYARAMKQLDDECAAAGLMEHHRPAEGCSS